MRESRNSYKPSPLPTLMQRKISLALSRARKMEKEQLPIEDLHYYEKTMRTMLGLGRYLRRAWWIDDHDAKRKNRLFPTVKKRKAYK